MTASTTPLLLGTRQVAEQLGVSSWRIRQLVADGTLQPVRLGEHGRYRFRRTDIERLVAGEPVGAS